MIDLRSFRKGWLKRRYSRIEKNQKAVKHRFSIFFRGCNHPNLSSTKGFAVQM